MPGAFRRVSDPCFGAIRGRPSPVFQSFYRIATYVTDLCCSAPSACRICDISPAHDSEGRLSSIRPKTKNKRSANYLKGNRIMKNRFVSNYRAWRKYRETYNELMRLSSRDLADLGINRAQIPVIARQSASL